ncbi:hypothetical protein ACGYK1_19400, partial [Sulfitobacter sp. 1A13191]
QPEPGAEATGGQGATAPAQPKEKGLQFGAMLRTLAAAGGNIHTARMIADAIEASGKTQREIAEEMGLLRPNC